MHIQWTAHLKGEAEKKSFTQSVKAAGHVLSRLEEIMSEKLKVAEKSSEADYDSPSWAYFAADRNGYKRALTELLQLLDISLDKRL